MLNHIDLRPILVNPKAAEILFLARGQLNRAFRSHGLIPPDPMALSDAENIDPMELDDPAAQGIDHAMAKFQGDFVAWAECDARQAGPAGAGYPLRQAHEALEGPQDGANPAAVAVRAACDFLSGCFHPDLACPEGTDPEYESLTAVALPDHRRNADGDDANGILSDLARV